MRAQAPNISNQDIILEQLAHRSANRALPTETLANWGYREMHAVNDPESGFRAVLYVPTGEVRAGQTERAQVARAIHGGTPPPTLIFR